MKVIHLIPQYAIGGVEVAAITMLDQVTVKFDFTLLTMAGEIITGKQSKSISSSNFSIHNPISYLLTIKKLNQEKPDYLICSLWRSSIVGLIYKLINKNVRLIRFVHNEKPVHLIDSVVERLMVSHCNYILADSSASASASASAKKHIISFLTEKHTPIYSSNKKLSASFIFWGRLKRQKRVDRAIILIHKLNQLKIDATFTIYGDDGGEYTNLKKLLAKLNISSKINLNGSASHSLIRESASKHSFYLQLSEYEGFSMSTVEAMQFGLVPIVTPVGEIKNYCADNKNAVILDDPDNIDKSVDKIIEILNNQERFNAIRNSAIRTWLDQKIYAEDLTAFIENHLLNSA